ncbi:MAG: ABC transporter ATP-binding protein [Paracoccus sp. (in: a-proteobacteria)]|uniref:energy-coupling factor ABC transporter ATP-binding protein n=1 Tax=Paracoccus sp. TaxID=267 RepID=UPI0026E0C777|nr:ABC transporter ATP-binding protein [Paracoccus sp. (in: a-proteobacteria)]MDO5620625.1 ABC transporter ATP-binding protein [Paracoccus sp. (in: a-proteobacteria)]
MSAAGFQIRLEDLHYQAGGRVILNGISLQSQARRIGVVGQNGSGKSTLARVVAGLIAPDQGRVTICGADMLRDRKAALRSVGMLFQNPEHQIIFPTVREEIAFGLRQLGQSRTEADEGAGAMLARFDRAHWLDLPVSILSQGQKHLLCIMAVLAMRPALLIMDEPFAGLDIPTRMRLARILDGAGVALLHISHDPQDLQGYDEVFWLDQGAIRAHGLAGEVLPDFTAEMIRQGECDDLADLAG